jgi:hypothetical protein
MANAGWTPEPENMKLVQDDAKEGHDGGQQPRIRQIPMTVSSSAPAGRGRPVGDVPNVVTVG